MPSISEFLISRLKSQGLEKAFGVPGDFILGFYKQLDDALGIIGTTNEESAGFAADAYARLKGVGCVVATYGVGALKLANSIGGAYSERSPVVIISGAPGVKERNGRMRVHHSVGNDYNFQLEVFKKLTCAQAVLDDPNTAGYEIERVLLALNQEKRPVYIEIPRDVLNQNINYDPYKIKPPVPKTSNIDNLNEALDEAGDWIDKSKNPVLFVGIDCARYGMGEIIAKFSKKYNIPIATTILAKSVVDESSPLSLGVYFGENSSKMARETVEESDCLIMIGVEFTDLNFGFGNSNLNSKNIISCGSNKVSIRNHTYENVLFNDFIKKFVDLNLSPREPKFFGSKNQEFVCNPSSKISVKRFFEKIDSILTKDMAVIPDVGDSLFGSLSFTVRNSNYFLAQAFYTSMGFSVPAALGVSQVKPKARSIVITGDGAFQMTGMEVSTIGKLKLNPIIFVLNNAGYTTERFILDGSFNDIPSWEYHKIPEVIGFGKGLLVKTEEDLEVGVAQALKDNCMYIFNIILDQKDRSVVLEKMAKKLSEKLL